MDREGADVGAIRPNVHRIGVGADALIAELAARQRGRVSRAQLVSAGVPVGAIKHRLACGRLIAEHDGVYAVGYRTGDRVGRFRSGLLAVGAGGTLSHLAAGASYAFNPDPVLIDITCPRSLRSRRGIRLHRHRLDPRDIHVRDGLPLTSPSQTLFDLATLLSAERLAKAANQAFVDRLVTIDGLYATLARNLSRKGANAFRRLLATLDPEGRVVRSPLEIRLNAFLRARGFPPWEQNVRMPIGSDLIEADVLWREQRMIVEADGRDPHLAPLTFASDRRRDRRVRVEGWEPVRVTSVDLDECPDELESDLRALLRLEPRN